MNNVKKKVGKTLLFAGALCFAYHLGKEKNRNDLLLEREKNARLRGQVENEVRTSTGLLRSVKDLCYHLGKNQNK